MVHTAYLSQSSHRSPSVTGGAPSEGPECTLWIRSVAPAFSLTAVNPWPEGNKNMVLRHLRDPWSEILWLIEQSHLKARCPSWWKERKWITGEALEPLHCEFQGELGLITAWLSNLGDSTSLSETPCPQRVVVGNKWGNGKVCTLCCFSWGSKLKSLKTVPQKVWLSYSLSLSLCHYVAQAGLEV
jgi:hypothetical protein